ncbi:MAG TPA: HAMP domain-containing sensor histidine kinase [Acidimicrobiales bacterium]|nr:HAMP domain-containing sensor histidine kinase [Acidimicrobiales bacterium]
MRAGQVRRAAVMLARRLIGSVRVRVTATALLAVGCALAVSAVVIRVDLQHDRQRVLMQTAEADARQVLAYNPELSTPIVLPGNPTIESGLVQVLFRGKVIGASRPLRKFGPLWEPGDPVVSPASDVFVSTARDVQQVTVPVQVGSGKHYVVVVASMQQFDHTVADVQRLLDIGSPMLLAVVGLICWVIVGRALRPIEMMRREVAEVAKVADHRSRHRVAEPANDDEVGRLARTLNSMLDRMEASTQRERRFVSDASHELRSPIANIRTELEVAMHHPGVANWWQVATGVLGQNERMEGLVSGLLLLARSDEGSLIEASEPTDLAHTVEMVVRDLPPGPPVVRLRIDPAPVRVPPVYAERMVANLVDNARRFASTAVDVSLTVGPGPGPVRLVVADDGPGVPEAERERIFERFVRLDEARDRGEGGFGLGLAIVADLSRFYGGTIRVGSGAPGAEFVLELPAALAPVAPAPVAPPVPSTT